MKKIFVSLCMIIFLMAPSFAKTTEISFINQQSTEELIWLERFEETGRYFLTSEYGEPFIITQLVLPLNSENFFSFTDPYLHYRSRPDTGLSFSSHAAEKPMVSEAGDGLAIISSDTTFYSSGFPGLSLDDMEAMFTKKKPQLPLPPTTFLIFACGLIGILVIRRRILP